MIPLSIGRATEVYRDVSRCEITRHSVDHPCLASVSRSLRSLVNALGDEAADEYWRQTIGPVRRLAFTYCSVPLPFSEAAEVLRVDWGKLDRQVRLCRQLFPDFAERLAALVRQVQELSHEADSPFIQPLERLCRDGGAFALVLRDIRMNVPVAGYLSRSPALQNVRVVSAQQLRGARLCDVLFAIGPCGWFPEYVFSAPRAASIHVLSYQWIRDAWKPGPIFLGSSGSPHGKKCNHLLGMVPQVGGIVRRTDPADILAGDLLPPLPNFSHAAAQSRQNDETVSARLCHLSGNRAVFVAADEGATSLVIDASEAGHAAVRRMRIDELMPGYFILLRTSGGGDYIAPLADRILGAAATTCRAQQTEWKERAVVSARRQFGSTSRRELASLICDQLHARNLSQARPANVHYWISSKCIRPRKSEDFEAILRFAGIGDRSAELWAAMGEIDRAHRRAGHLIRRMLLRKIAETSLEQLERDGEMVFDLGDHDGGTLSAFQITGIQGEEFEVPTDRIGVLLDGEE